MRRAISYNNPESQIYQTQEWKKMGKAKKTRKFAATKRIITNKDQKM